MNESLLYTKSEKISLKMHFNEKWVQDRIEEDPRILGLGELDVIHRERRQSSGGRLDFLFMNSETDTMYETEIMLGATDESHIIRVIEYWDIERKRYPSKDHRAVIVAEEITNRFFNVISLMNRSILIIAIQLNALKIENKIVLNFTTVLDVYEEPEDEQKLGGEEVSRPYWMKRSNEKSIAIMDSLIALAQGLYPRSKVTYNKHHVALGTTRQNYMWFHPRKSPYTYVEIRLGKEYIDKAKAILEEIGIPFTSRKEDILSISIQEESLKKNVEQFKDLMQQSIQLFS
jgi:hypothetical protein